jgi:hypothetical protein
MPIWSTGAFNQEVDVDIHSDNGSRSLVIDLWDPAASPSGNEVSVWGQISILGEGIIGDGGGGGGFIDGVIDEGNGLVA